jgi:mono/diheme cytochrome c family protein
MSPVAKSLTVPEILQRRSSRRLSLLVCSLWIVLAFSACGSSNSGSVFDSDAGQHAANWADPLAIGRSDFHSGPIKSVQSDSRGAVLFGMRCGICHGNGGVGKIGPDIRRANGTIITGAIAFVPLMKGQSDLSPVDIQDVAAYLATLLAGAHPAASTIQTENCVGCHGGALDGGIARVSCFSCHNGPGGVVGHQAAWSLPATDPVNFHGSYGRKYSDSCTTCHGVNFEGAIGRACASCHNGTVAPVLDFLPVLGQPGGQAVTIITTLSGTQEVPPTVTAGSGTAILTIDLNTGAVGGTVTFTGLTSNTTAAHIHQGAAGVNGPVIVPLAGGAGATSGTWTVPAGSTLTPSQLVALRSDGLYVNIHTANNPGGEIRGQIRFSNLIALTTGLSGAAEVPVAATPGSGTASLTVDLDSGAVSGTVTFTGLTSNATAAHIHQGAAGVNGPVILPLAGGAGAISGTWTVPAGSVLTASQLTALKTNGLYVNIHTVNNSAGEIRGQIDFTGKITLSLPMNGAQEVPAVATPGAGAAVLTVNLNTGSISGSLTFTGLTSNATAAHIHQGSAGVNGPVIVPLAGGAGATAGIWSVPAGTFLTAAQLTALKTNGLYVNIHTVNNPAGEIRGQIDIP